MMKIFAVLGCVFCSIIAVICCCASIYGFYENDWKCGITYTIWTITMIINTITFYFDYKMFSSRINFYGE